MTANSSSKRRDHKATRQRIAPSYRRIGSRISGARRRPDRSFACHEAVVYSVHWPSGGRFIAGLGVSGPQIVEGWYGQPWGRPYYRVKDYVAIMRKIFKREGPVTHEGREISASKQRSICCTIQRFLHTASTGGR
jgi:hypothetical protein